MQELLEVAEKTGIMKCGGDVNYDCYCKTLDAMPNASGRSGLARHG
jgi:hypothetical protein